MILSQFLLKDWNKKNPMWLMNSALEFAEATALLA